MLRIQKVLKIKTKLPFKPIVAQRTLASQAQPSKELPASADVVIIGGGSAGCHTLYHLAKRGVKAVLLERAKLTAGTTWHTAGLVWRLRPNDVEIEYVHFKINCINLSNKGP